MHAIPILAIMMHIATVDMKERCLLCGGSQSTIMTSHWVSKKLLIIILYCVFPLLCARYYVDPM